MATTTLTQTNSADGTPSSAPVKVPVTVPDEMVRSTDGGTVILPFNKYSLYDTQPLAQKMSFFLPGPTGGTLRSNYNQMPPNGSEETIITHLGVQPNVFTVESYDGGGTAANAVKGTQILNLLTGGNLVVKQTNDNKHLVQEPLSRFLDFSKASVHIDGTKTVVTLPPTQQLVPLTEAVVIQKGLGYVVEIELASSAGIPTAAGYAAANQIPVELKVRAEHRGTR